MGGKNPIVIEKERLLLVEGNDEQHFLAGVLTFLVPDSKPVQIISFNGEDKLGAVLKLLSMQSEFGMVTKIAVVRDNDNDPSASFAKVRAAIQMCGLVEPTNPEEFSTGSPAVGAFMSPGKNETGALEALCMKSLQAHPQNQCIENFLNCVQASGVTVSHPDKLRMRAFIATLEKGIRLIGEAVRAGKIDFAHSAFDDLKTFIQALLS